VPRALLLTGDAAEELDTMYPYYRVQEGGWDVDVSSRTMRDVQLVIHEFDPNSDAYVEKNGRKLPVDVPWADVDVARYDALIIPGGRAPEWIRVDADVRRITEHFFAQDLPIALVCHGAQVPAVYGLLKGRKTACFRRRGRQPRLLSGVARHAAVRPGDDGPVRQARRLHLDMSTAVHLR
jgi:protease I